MKQNQSLVVFVLTALSMIIPPAAYADPAGKSRNPRTGQTVKVGPATVPAFLAGSDLKATAPKPQKTPKAGPVRTPVPKASH